MVLHPGVERAAASRTRTRKWEIKTHDKWEIMTHGFFFKSDNSRIPSTASAAVRLLLSKAITRAPLPMPSTRPGAHIGADKAPSMVLLEMFWLVAEVSGEVDEHIQRHVKL
ncbi:predicted protein [Postia placenta Mad-698-R]|nr:predicted protein [Postia placenta Mad-698-R]